MLTDYEKQSGDLQRTVESVGSDSSLVEATVEPSPRAKNDWMSRILRIEWLGQTAASLFWIASVLTYGISAAGDWLQLAAASAWLIANVATIVSVEAD